MNERQRHHGILSLLAENKTIQVAHITEMFAVSPATARRDITKLYQQGKLIKVRNGAEQLNKQPKKWVPLQINEVVEQPTEQAEKVRISRYAATLCQPGDCVVINCGSTAFLLGQQLSGQAVQIVTNYFPLASYLIHEEHADLVIIGGQYHKTQHTFLTSTVDSLRGYAGNWMFTSGKGLTAKGLYKTDMLTAVVEQQMLEQVDKLVVVVDSSKVGKQAGMLFCSCKKIDIVITGKESEASVVREIEKQGVQVILV